RTPAYDSCLEQTVACLRLTTPSKRTGRLRMRKFVCRVLVSIVTFLLGIACGPSAPNAGAIPELKRGPRAISEIRLQRQGCTDPSEECRKYDVTFYRDGTARYVGYEHSPDFIGS